MLHPDLQGSAFIVTSVQTGSVAEKTGIVAGDVIDQISGRNIQSARDFGEAFNATNASVVRLRFRRAGDWFERDLPVVPRSTKPARSRS